MKYYIEELFPSGTFRILFYLSTLIAIGVLLFEIIFLIQGGIPGITTMIYGLPFGLILKLFVEKSDMTFEGDIFNYWPILLAIYYFLYSLVLYLVSLIFRKFR